MTDDAEEHRCQHANDRERRTLRPGEQPDHDIMCGRPACLWRLPDMTTGYYCAEHGPKVLVRVQRRLELNGGYAVARPHD